MLKANGSHTQKGSPSFFTCAQRKSPNCLVKCEAPRLRAASFFIRRLRKKHKGSNCVCVCAARLPLAAMVSIKFIAAIDSHLYTFFTPAAGRPATHKTTALKAGGAWNIYAPARKKMERTEIYTHPGIALLTARIFPRLSHSRASRGISRLKQIYF